jgi:hypothetical protein
MEVARNCRASATLIIRNAETLLPAQRVEIARNAAGRVIFEL